MRDLILLVFTLTLFMSSCTSNDISGTTTETTGGYAGIVLAEDGIPVENALVSLYNIDDKVFEDTTRSDEKGRFTIYPDSAVEYHMMISSLDSTTSSWHYFPFKSISDTVKSILKDPASCNIALTNATDGKVIGLAATPFSTNVSGGLISWNGLPTGSYTLFDSVDSKIKLLGSFNVATNSSALLTLDYDTAGFLLDDFNDGDSLPLFFPLLNYNWRKEIETATSLKSRIESDSAGGYYFHIADSGIGMLRKVMTRIGYDLDFSNLDSITFRAKGDGVLRVSLEDSYGPEIVDIHKVLFKVTLSSDWKKYSIDVNNHSDIEYANTGSWDEMKGAVDYFTLFMYSDENDLCIDDIRLHGVDDVMLFP